MAGLQERVYCPKSLALAIAEWVRGTEAESSSWTFDKTRVVVAGGGAAFRLWDDWRQNRPRAPYEETPLWMLIQAEVIDLTYRAFYEAEVKDEPDYTKLSVTMRELISWLNRDG